MKKKQKGWISIWIIVAILVSVVFPISNSLADSQQQRKGFYEGEGFQVQFDVTEAWDGEYNASVTITNTRDVTIDLWFLKFPFAQKITNLWNGVRKEEKDGFVIIKNATYNQDISPGESVTFGMTVEGKLEEYPDKYELLGKRAVVEEENYSVSYQVTEDWGSGFIGAVVIKNTSDQAIEDWGLECYFGNPIQNIWNALIASQEGNYFKICNAGYNQNIGVGESVEFGFQVIGGDSEHVVREICVTNISLEEDTSGTGGSEGGEDSKEESGKDDPEQEEPEKGGVHTEEPGKDQTGEILSVSEKGLILTESGYLLNEDFSTFTGSLKRVEQVNELTVKVYDKKDILIYQENIAPKSVWRMEQVGLVYGVNRLVFSVVTKDGYEETKEITVQINISAYMENLQVDCGDTDGDGLMNYLEDVFGTDQTEKDTDGDGLTDYEELYLFGYHPWEADTDGDGISDFDEDEDEDGISNGKELRMGTLPLNDDSDHDGLSDGEELAFGTSPLDPNTHGKEITDYEEFQLEQLQCDYNAETEQYTKTFCYEQGEEEVKEPVVPTLTFTGDVQGVLSFQMKRVSGNVYFNPSMTGYLGAAFDFTTAGTLNQAELTFTYDEKRLGRDLVSQQSFCPTIYYYNEDTGILEEVEGQVWKGNQVTAVLSHFSIYILANKADLEALWERTQIVDNTLTKGEKPVKETVFVVDYSEQMEQYDSNAVHRKEIVLDYIDHQWEEDEKFYLYIMGVKNGNSISSFFPNKKFTKESVREEVCKAFDQARRYGHENNIRQLGSDFCLSRAVLRGFWLARDGEKEDETPTHRNMYWMTNGSFASLPIIPNWYDVYQSAKYLYQDSEKFGFACQMIGFGSEKDKKELLQEMAERTGGDYYQYAPGFDTNHCYQETQPDSSGDDTDKNKDGLNDALERKICDGEMTTITGTTIFSPDSYDKLMESDDYDGDGLKNGEEIEIYQYRKATYFRLKSLPYLYDSDGDGSSDYEEVKERNTPPDKANFVMKYADIAYLNNMDQFESVKAFNKYVDSKGIGNVAAKTLDVLFCGGEINLNKAMSKELAECLAEDAKENETAAMAAGIADITNTYVSGLVALLPEMNEMDYAFRKDDYLESLNNLQRAIGTLKKDGDSEELLHTLQTNLQNHRNVWKSDIVRLSEKADKIEKYGTVASFAVGLVSSTADEVNEWTEYYAGMSQLAGYRDVLQKLSCCKAENVEVAARKILKELEGKYGDALKKATANIFFDFVIIVIKTMLSAGLNKISPFIALADITTGIVLGDSMSVGLQNSVSVSIALELSVLSNNTVTANVVHKDYSGNSQAVYDNTSNYMFTRKLWLSTIYSIKCCEGNYKSYIFSDTSLFNRNMLYFTKDSIMNVTNNLIELKRIQNQTVM